MMIELKKTKQLLKAIAPILFFSFTITSCSKVFTGIYGMKSLIHLEEDAIIKYAEKYNIPLKDTYELDTSYFSYLLSLDTLKYKSQIKNHYQPLQVLYYSNDGNLKSFQANCYAGGFPNLNWNRNETFSEFPPKQQATLDSIINLEQQMSFIKDLSTTNKFSLKDLDYVILVYWSRYMGRQSKRLIELVQENKKLAKDIEAKIIYVNTDNLFAFESE